MSMKNQDMINRSTGFSLSLLPLAHFQKEYLAAPAQRLNSSCKLMNVAHGTHDLQVHSFPPGSNPHPARKHPSLRLSSDYFG